MVLWFSCLAAALDRQCAPRLALSQPLSMTIQPAHRRHCTIERINPNSSTGLRGGLGVLQSSVACKLDAGKVDRDRQGNLRGDARSAAMGRERERHGWIGLRRGVGGRSVSCPGTTGSRASCCSAAAPGPAISPGRSCGPCSTIPGQSRGPPQHARDALRRAFEAGDVHRPHGPDHQRICRDRELAGLHRAVLDARRPRRSHQDRHGSAILDNASIVANPTHPHTAPAPEVRIGDQVLVAYGARRAAPATIGAYGSAASRVEIGPVARWSTGRRSSPARSSGRWRGSGPA